MGWDNFVTRGFVADWPQHTTRLYNKRPWVAFFSKFFHYIVFQVERTQCFVLELVVVLLLRHREAQPSIPENGGGWEAGLGGGGARIMIATSSYSRDFGNSDATDLPQTPHVYTRIRILFV